MLEDRRLGREQSLLEEGGSGLADVLLSLDTEGGGDGLKGPAQCHVPAGAQALAVILAFSRFARDLYCRLNPERYIHTSYRISESTSRVTPYPRYWGAILYTCFVRVEIGQKCYKA